MLRALFIISLLVVGCLLVLSERSLLSKYFIKFNDLYNTVSSKPSPSEGENSDFYTLFDTEVKKLKNQSDARLFKVKSLKWNIRDPDIKITDLSSIKEFEIDSNALLSLEVEIFSQIDTKDKTTITQFSYIENESKNKVIEFSRAFVTQDKKKPD